MTLTIEEFWSCTLQAVSAFLRLIWGYEESPHRCSAVLSPLYQEHLQSPCLACDTDLKPLAGQCLPGFIALFLSTSPPSCHSLWTQIIKCGPPSRGRVLRSTSFREYLHKLFGIIYIRDCVFNIYWFVQIFLCISMDSFMGIYFILRNKIQGKLCKLFQHWLMLAPSDRSLCPCDQFTFFWFLSTSLLSGTARCSRLILSISCPRISHLFKEWIGWFWPIFSNRMLTVLTTPSNLASLSGSS